MEEHDEIISRIIGITNTTDPDPEIYLYGSRARGDAKRNSDWDFLILLSNENITFPIETDLIDKFYEVELETGQIISPLIYSRKEWNEKHFFTPLSENIRKQGIRIR